MSSSSIFDYLIQLDSFFWGYLAFILILLLGLTLTIKTRFFQIRAFPSILKTFFSLMKKQPEARGVHPLKVFFASVGGMIGIGNIVGIITAIQIGGPGALFWVWMAALVGTVIKYSEVFLGLKHRVVNDKGGYDGGPMYFLQLAFNNRWIPILVSALLCIYGVEIYQFAVVTDSLTTNFDINRYVVMASLLLLILYSSSGGISRLGKVCAWIMPAFVILYALMSFWIIFKEAALLPDVLKNVLVSAFTGHAAVGGFAGSSVLLAIQHGISRAAYSADIGIGYDSIIQSESNTVHPERQARLAVLGVCIDNFICTLSILVVLLSGIWKSPEQIQGSLIVQTALSQYFPYMHIFMPVFLFVAGYTTLIAYFCVGIKCARFLNPKYGMPLYIAYGTISWIFFSFFDQTQALLVMSLSGACLLIANLLGIFILRNQIVFGDESSESVAEPILSCVNLETAIQENKSNSG